MPVINCPGCNKPYKAPEVIPPNMACPHCRRLHTAASNRGDTFIPPGWLVVHDEYASQQIFELKPGKNTFGRKAGTSAANCQIDFGTQASDKYMSRLHCEVNVLPKEGQQGFDLLLRDLSTNGTFINARMDQKLFREVDEIYLSHEDVIQMGRTKLIVILGTRVTDIRAKAQDLLRTNFHETVIHFDV